MLGHVVHSVTIANNAAASNAFSFKGYRIAGIVKPATWTAADISFEVAADDGSSTFVKVVNNDGAIVRITGVSTTVAEYMIVPEIGDAIVGNSAKVVSTNTASEADANQGGDRVLMVVLIPLEGR